MGVRVQVSMLACSYSVIGLVMFSGKGRVRFVLLGGDVMFVVTLSGRVRLVMLAGRTVLSPEMVMLVWFSGDVMLVWFSGVGVFIVMLSSGVVFSGGAVSMMFSGEVLGNISLTMVK